MSEIRTFRQLRLQGRQARVYGLGMWSFLLHRLTGLGLVLYLFMHLWVISSSTGGPAAFDELMVRLRSPLYIALDLLLVAVVLFHSLNGIRLLLFDVGVGIRRQRQLFWGLMLAGALLLAAAAAVSLPHLADAIRPASHVPGRSG